MSLFVIAHPTVLAKNISRIFLRVMTWSRQRQRHSRARRRWGCSFRPTGVPHAGPLRLTSLCSTTNAARNMKIISRQALHCTIYTCFRLHVSAGSWARPRVMYTLYASTQSPCPRLRGLCIRSHVQLKNSTTTEPTMLSWRCKECTLYLVSMDDTFPTCWL